MNKSERSGDRTRALFVVSSTNRRGAEIQAMTIATGLATRGFDIRTAALTAGTHGDQLDVPTLGPTARSLPTLRALRRGAHDVDVVVAYGSSTLPACALALFGTGVPFVYRNIGDPYATTTSTSCAPRRNARSVASDRAVGPSVGTSSWSPWVPGASAAVRMSKPRFASPVAMVIA